MAWVNKEMQVTGARPASLWLMMDNPFHLSSATAAIIISASTMGLEGGLGWLSPERGRHLPPVVPRHHHHHHHQSRERGPCPSQKSRARARPVSPGGH